LNVYGAGLSNFHQTGFNRSFYAQQGTIGDYLTRKRPDAETSELVQAFASVVQYGSIGEEFASERELFARGEYVVNVSCGEAHSVFVTNHRRVFCCGSNAYGSCALPESIFVVEQVTLIPELTNCNIVETKSGKHHTFFISAGYEHVYVTGRNSYGECGVLTASQIYGVEQWKSIEDKKLKLVAPGAYHTVFVTDDNCVYTSGYCSFGSLGQGHKIRPSSVPIGVNHPDLCGVMAIKAVSCGRYHSIVITEHGSAYSWGYNYGQCGLEFRYRDDVLSPVLITNLPQSERLADARCGQDFTVFRTESNKFYGCGENYKGNFQSIITEIPLSIGTVLDYNCGENYVVLVSMEGRVYVYGEKMYCGFSPNEDSSQDDDELMEISLPRTCHGSIDSELRVACGQTGSQHTFLYRVPIPHSIIPSKLLVAQQMGLLCDITLLTTN